MKNSGLLALLSAAFVFSTFGVLIRVLNASFGPVTQTTVRFGIALGIVVLIIVFKKIPFQLSGINKYAAIVFAASFPLMTVLFTQAVINTKATNALFLLFATSLIFSFVAGRVYFGEGITVRKCVAGLLCLLGIASFADIFHLQLSIGAVLAVIAGLFEGLANTSRKILGLSNLWMLLLFQFSIGVALTLVVAKSSGEVMVDDVSWPVVLAAIWFGVSILLGSVLLNYGFAHSELNLGTIIFSSELVFAMTLNRIVLGEIPTPLEYAGAVAILSAILAINLRLPPIIRGVRSDTHPPCQN